MREEASAYNWRRRLTAPMSSSLCLSHCATRVTSVSSSPMATQLSLAALLSAREGTNPPVVGVTCLHADGSLALGVYLGRVVLMYVCGRSTSA